MKKKRYKIHHHKSNKHHNHNNQKPRNIKTMNTNTKNPSTTQNPLNSSPDLASEIAALTAEAFCNFMRKNTHKDFSLQELKIITDITSKIVSYHTRLKNIEIKMQKQNVQEKIQNSKPEQPAANNDNEHSKAEIFDKKNKKLKNAYRHSLLEPSKPSHTSTGFANSDFNDGYQSSEALNLAKVSPNY